MPQVIMPKMGDAMEEGTLLKWLKSQGDEVAEGDPLAEIETDKVTLEIEATDAGVLTRTLVNEGDTVPIGTAIATIGEDGSADGAADGAADSTADSAPEEAEKPAAVAEAPSTGEERGQPAPAVDRQETPPAQPKRPAAAATAQPAPPPGANGASAPERAAGERLRASPLVKRLAAEHGIDLRQVAGSGPGG
nr:E3 binding domain-containing protein [Chloroflexia bacterium]